MRSRRSPLLPWGPGISLVSDCAGQGSVPQALAHLGIQVRVAVATELDPNKRALLKVVHESIGCKVDRMMADVHEHLEFLRGCKASSWSTPDIFEAGYPCQSFTRSGLKKGIEDCRGQVWLAGLENISRTQARAFVLEQVPDIESDIKFRPMFLRSLDVLRAAGYQVDYKIMETSRNGLPQHRRRLYVLGVRTDVKMILGSTDWYSVAVLRI
ncbi:unnamed protein product [Symbiodinium sp. CCMP2592]|nr:unnamed protein product [Symbiodinium sp. CCMP2592]